MKNDFIAIIFALISYNLLENIRGLGVFCEVITGVVSMTGAFIYSPGVTKPMLSSSMASLSQLVEMKIFKTLSMISFAHLQSFH